MSVLTGTRLGFVCTWAQDERPADLHMAQPNVPVSKTGHIPPARLLVRGERCRETTLELDLALTMPATA
jgi:hypothetical protein